MLIESQVVAVSWIPMEAVDGVMKAPFELGVSHYDLPPPDVLGDLEEWRAEDRFRIANDLRAWVEVDGDGVVVDAGYAGGGVLGSTTLALGASAFTFSAVGFPDLQEPPEVGDGWVRFQQTVGGRTGVPAPRRVTEPPYVQYTAPTAWTTLSLTIHTDGRVEHGLVGASPFPRHWVYGPDGSLVAKSGLIDFKAWYRKAFGERSPWGGEDLPAVVAEAESMTERELSTLILGEGDPKVRKVKAGRAITRQGEEASAVYLLLDGVARVEVDGEVIAQIGPGALIGERSALEDGRRSATVVAVSACKLAEARSADLDHQALTKVSDSHRREERRQPSPVTRREGSPR